MAGTRLQTREQRKKLAARNKPYFADLRRGLSVGYRKGVEGGSWVLREFRSGKHVQRRIAVADDDVPADGTAVLSWQQAVQKALGSDRPTVTVPGRLTVSGAWENYKAARKNPLDAREVSTWERFIEPVLGNREVSELTSHELNKWLNDQVHQHGLRGQALGGDEQDKVRRARDTANRRWNLLRAVLNYAFESEAVTSDTAWRKVKSFRKVGRPRKVTATAEQATTLLSKLSGPGLDLAKGALYTAMRLSELLRLRADDIDLPGLNVRVRHTKGGDERYIPINREGASFFAERVRGKSAGDVILEPLHSDPRVNRVYLSRAMREASDAANITPRVTFHDLRRTYGSLMLNAGVPIEIVQEVLGHADLRMTRQTYAHLLQKTIAKSVQKHLPSFNPGSPKEKRARTGR